MPRSESSTQETEALAIPDETPGEAQTVDSRRHKRVQKLREAGAATVREETSREPRRGPGRPPGSKNKSHKKKTETPADDNEPSPAAIAGWEEMILQSNTLLLKLDAALEIPSKNSDGTPGDFSLCYTKDEAKAGGRAWAKAAAAVADIEWLNRAAPFLALGFWLGCTTIPRLFIVAKAMEIIEARKKANEPSPPTDPKGTMKVMPK